MAAALPYNTLCALKSCPRLHGSEHKAISYR
jgi:hypothetical protein